MAQSLTSATIASTYKTLLKAGTQSGGTVALSSGSTTERLVFGEDDAADVRTSIYVSQDRVGIGTSEPHSNLHVNSATAQIRVTDSDSGAGNGDGLYIEQDGDVSYFINREADKMHLGTSGTVDLTIDSAGKVGIGTTVPGTQLEVRGDASTPGAVITISTADTDVASGADIGALVFTVPLEAGGTDSITPAGAIWCQAEDTFAADNNKASLRFGTGNSSTAYATANVRMLIDEDGSVGIGELTPGYKLEVNESTVTTSCAINVQSNTLSDGQSTSFRVEANGKDQAYLQSIHNSTTYAGALRLEDDGDVGYYLYHDGGTWITSNTYSNIGTSTGTVVGDQSSDERLKNINSDPFPYGLEKINKLIPIQFKWKDGRKKDTNQLGFGAQTTQSILPEAVYDTGNCIDGNKKHEEHGALVSKNDNTELGMQYVQIIPVLVKAIQELSAKVTALESA